MHSQLLNKDLEWEKNSNLNVGVELALFDFFRGEVDVFNRVSSNLLFKAPRPQSTGIEYMWQNIGTMRNTGLELTLGFDIFKKSDFRWSLDLNATFFKNKITKMPKDSDGNPQEIINGTKNFPKDTLFMISGYGNMPVSIRKTVVHCITKISRMRTAM